MEVGLEAFMRNMASFGKPWGGRDTLLQRLTARYSADDSGCGGWPWHVPALRGAWNALWEYNLGPAIKSVA